MRQEEYKEHPCDLCGSDQAVEIECARHYTAEQPVHVCKDCGFVYIRQRRSAEAIADAWSNEIFGQSYTAKIPAVKARQVLVAEMLHTTIGLHGKTLCDIGGGEGQFLDIARGPDYGATVYAVEPSREFCTRLSNAGIDNFCGTVEEYSASSESQDRRFDVVTIMWTLENCQDCRTMLEAAYEVLEPNGYVCVATGSRILVPFKKPLHLYLSTNPADTHCFRFSANSLRGILAQTGFKVEHVNRYIDQDVLCMIAQKTDGPRDISWQRDDWRDVIDFFSRWHKETQDHYTPP